MWARTMPGSGAMYSAPNYWFPGGKVNRPQVAGPSTGQEDLQGVPQVDTVVQATPESPHSEYADDSIGKNIFCIVT